MFEFLLFKIDLQPDGGIDMASAVAITLLMKSSITIVLHLVWLLNIGSKGFRSQKLHVSDRPNVFI